MNKIGLIFKREYLARVRNKTFLLSTFLLPIVFVAFIFGTAYLSIKALSNNKIAVYDPNNYLKDVLKGNSNLKFNFINASGTPTLVYEKNDYNALLVIPEWDGKSKLKYTLRSSKKLGISATSKIEDKINDAIEDKILQKQGLTSVMLDSLRRTAPKADEDLTDKEGNTKTSSGISYIIGFVSGFLIYIMMIVYGIMVMRGVSEEKNSRIAEVIISSVKPFQLMMGKILGIGAVGLTQFLLWLILIFGLAALLPLFIPHDTLQQVAEAQQSNPMQANMPGGNAMQSSRNILGALGVINWVKIIPCFLFYFLGGYLFYAALFASVGCMASEDSQDSQSLSFPIMMPVIFGIIIMQTTIQNPDSSLAFWGSIIPFTSPIIMMARISSDPPAWQIALSMALLIGGFLGTTWMAGKIYRTGILMYGKKGSWKQMMKWVFAKS